MDAIIDGDGLLTPAGIDFNPVRMFLATFISMECGLSGVGANESACVRAAADKFCSSCTDSNGTSTRAVVDGISTSDVVLLVLAGMTGEGEDATRNRLMATLPASGVRIRSTP